MSCCCVDMQVMCVNKQIMLSRQGAEIKSTGTEQLLKTGQALGVHSSHNELEAERTL